jgi:hypothetical protein
VCGVENAHGDEPADDGGWKAAAASVRAVRVEWDIDLDLWRSNPVGDPRFELNFIERSVRLVALAWLRTMAMDPAGPAVVSTPGVVNAMLHPPELAGRGRQYVSNAVIRRIRITGIEEDDARRRMLVYVDVQGRRCAVDEAGLVIAGDPAADVEFAEFWTLDPHGVEEWPWRLIDLVCRMRDARRDFAFVARGETGAEFSARIAAACGRPPAPSPLRRMRVTGIRRQAGDRAGERVEVTVELDAAPVSWQAERILFAADEPKLAESLRSFYFDPRYVSIEVVELCDEPSALRDPTGRELAG